MVTSLISISLFSQRAVLTADAWAAPIDVVAELAIQITDMLPGDRQSGELTIQNMGVDPLRYALISESTDPDSKGLLTVLVAEVKDEGSGCAAFDGRTLYRGSLTDAGFGSPLSGAQPGDRILGPAERETLCVVVSLPDGAGDRHQLAMTATTFTVVAEHAAVNR